jgi:hypothetical protein
MTTQDEVEKIRKLADQLLIVLHGEPANVACISLVECMIRVVKSQRPEYDNTDASMAIIKTIVDMMSAEREWERTRGTN